MERAANACSTFIQTNFPDVTDVHIFCGNGNNGGDGLAIARILSVKNFNCKVWCLHASSHSSQDFQENYDRLQKIKSVKVIDISSVNDLSIISPGAIIVDALLGSGINKPASGILLDIINFINRQPATVISIDVPSGLNPEELFSGSSTTSVQADFTLCFETPYFSYLFSEAERYIGEFVILPIALHQDYYAQVKVKDFYTDIALVKSILRKRPKFVHKGTYGHALLLAASKGKAGAAVLASRACLRAGCGLLTTHVPSSLADVIHVSVPEAMVESDDSIDNITAIKSLNKYNSIGVGPGIGTEDQTKNVLKLLIQNTPVPLVLDADAINILSENKTWISFLPVNTILTPHVKEFERLTGKCNNSYERYERAKEFAFKYKCYLILKGAHTLVACPDGKAFFNSTGNPGMATAGSGDVLTGILTSLMAQGYSSEEACILGVFVHGLAGDIAVIHTGEEALIAGDIIDNLGAAFIRLNNYNEKR